MSDREEYRLDEICDFINGGAWSDSEYTEKGIPVVKVSNLKNDDIVFDKIDYISVNSLEKYKKHILKENDLIIATVGSHPSLLSSVAGRSVLVKKEMEGNLLNQNAVCLRTKNNEILDQRFLGYFAKTQLFMNYIQNRGGGAANQMRIAIGGIKSFKLKIPKEQKKIAKILSNYDDLIENNLKRIKLLEESARLTYEEWFLRFRIDGKKLYIDSKTGLPFEWEKRKLNSLISYYIGGGWGDDTKSDNFNSEAYVIRGTDIDDILNGSIANVPFRYHKLSNLKSRKLQAKDIIFEVSGGSRIEGVAKSLLITDGLLKQFKNDVMCASFCKLVRPKESNLANILFLSFRYLRESKATEVFEIRSASSIVNYNWEAFLKHQEIIIPNQETLKKFDSQIDLIFNEIYNLGTQNQLLKEARDILLPRLMTGKIDVDALEVEV